MERRAWIDELVGGRKRLDGGMRARAGVLSHHEAIYGEPPSTPTAGSSSSELALTDVSESSSSEAEGGGESAGGGASVPAAACTATPSLHEWLAQQAHSLESRSEADEEGDLIFIGFSLGGALAQMTALRVAYELPELARHIRVLALGATQWASPPLVSAFAERFGAQAVHLLTATQLSSDPERETVAVGGTQRAPPAALAIPLSAIREDLAAAHEPPSGQSSPRDGSYGASRSLWTLGNATLVDPMTLGFTEQTSYTHNLILCEAPAEPREGGVSRHDTPPAGRTTPPLADAQPRSQLLRPSSAMSTGAIRIARASKDSVGSRAESVASSGSSEQSDARPPTVPESNASSLSDASTRAPTLLRRGTAPTLQRRANASASRTASAARAITRRLDNTPLAASAAAGADSQVLALVNSTGSRSQEPTAWPLLRGKREGLLALRRRRPDAGHEHAYHSYWSGSITPHHPFANDVRSLHTGRAYRSALIKEHTRLRSWAADGGPHGAAGAAPASSTTCDTLAQVAADSHLPLAMLIDGAWDCQAGVLYMHKDKHGGVGKFEAEPTKGLHRPMMKRLTSISSAMDDMDKMDPIDLMF